MRSGSKVQWAALAGIAVGALLAGRSAASPAPRGVTISVPGIPGPYCMYGLEKRLREMPEVESVRLRWEQEEIQVRLKAGASVTRGQIEAAIDRAEYPYPHSVRL
jgi:hypothetical protein